MVKITKNEAEYIRNRGMGYLIHISSGTHKSRSKRYYMTEDKRGLKFLQQYRKQSISYTYYGNNQKNKK